MMEQRLGEVSKQVKNYQVRSTCTYLCRRSVDPVLQVNRRNVKCSNKVEIFSGEHIQLLRLTSAVQGQGRSSSFTARCAPWLGRYRADLTALLPSTCSCRARSFIRTITPQPRAWLRQWTRRLPHSSRSCLRRYMRGTSSPHAGHFINSKKQNTKPCESFLLKEYQEIVLFTAPLSCLGDHFLSVLLGRTLGF